MPDDWLRYVRSQVQRFRTLRLPHDAAKPPGPPAQDLVWTARLGLQRFWRLRWRIKGPVLAVLALGVLGAYGSIAGGGSDNSATALSDKLIGIQSTATPTPAPMLTIDYPADGAVINKADLLICGSAAAGAVVGRNIQFQSDPKMTADGSGHWEYRTTLEEGDHDFEFYLDDSQDTRAKIKVIYSPGAPDSPLVACPAQPGSTIAAEPTVASTPLHTLAPTPTVVLPPTAVPTPTPVPLFLTLDYPTSGATVTSPDVVVTGSALPNAEIRHDITGPDEILYADASGHWQYAATLKEGTNDFTFHLQDNTDITAQTTIFYAPVPTPLPTLAYLLELESSHCTLDASVGFAYIEGEVKNISDQPLSDILAVGEWYKSDNTFITSDNALTTFNPILPGQTSPFKTYSTYNPEMGLCRVNFTDFSGATIPYKKK
jgi:hypothetical protein